MLSVHANVLEPEWAAVFAVEPLFAVGEAAGFAAGAFGVVGTVEEGDVLVADVAEPERRNSVSQSQFKSRQEGTGDIPVYLALILKQAQRNAMHGRITPPLVEESTGPVQVLKVIHIRLAPPEPEIPNLKVRPKMTRRVPVRLLFIFRPPRPIRQPFHGIVLMHIARMIRNELPRFGPQRRHTFRRVVDVDVEAVRLVVVLHPAEDVVVDVAEEVDVWLDAPVILVFGEGGV